MVDVDVSVAGGLDIEVDQRMLTQRGEHVVIEGHRGVDVGPTRSIQVDGDGNLDSEVWRLRDATRCSVMLLPPAMLHETGRFRRAFLP